MCIIDELAQNYDRKNMCPSKTLSYTEYEKKFESNFTNFDMDNNRSKSKKSKSRIFSKFFF